MIVTFWICLIFTVKAIAGQDEKIDCKSNPCQNDATCLSQPTEGREYYCLCGKDFSGINCENESDSHDVPSSTENFLPSSSSAFTTQTHATSTYNENATENLSSIKGTTKSLRTSSLPQSTPTDLSMSIDISTDKGTLTTISKKSGLTSSITRPFTDTSKPFNEEEDNLFKSAEDDEDSVQENHFTEERPETSTVICDPNPCRNGGTCYNQCNEINGGDYICACDMNFSGLHCENEITTSPHTSTEDSKSTFSSSYTTLPQTTANEDKSTSNEENISTISSSYTTMSPTTANEVKSTSNENNTSTFSSSYTTMSPTTANEDKSTSNENIASMSTPLVFTEKSTTTLQEKFTKNQMDNTESTEAFLTNVTTSFHELNITTPSTTKLVSSQITQSTYFSVSPEQKTLSVITTEQQEEITSNGASSIKDTVTPSTTAEEAGSTVTFSDLVNATISLPDTSINNKTPVAVYAGIGILSLIVILILTGGIIYTKKYREKKGISLYANVLGDETSSISNGSNCSFA